jgi:hypothetical protein
MTVCLPRGPALPIALGILTAIAILSAVAVPAAPGGRGAASFAVYEGIVVDIGDHAAEDGVEAISVRLDVEGTSHWILLGPESVLAAEGFVVAAGDRLKVRVFVDDTPANGEAPEVAQRVLNTTHRGMIRLRSLHRTPLWDAPPFTGRDEGPVPRTRPGPDRTGPRNNGSGGDLPR